MRSNRKSLNLARLFREFGFLQLQAKAVHFLAQQLTRDLHVQQSGGGELQLGPAQELLKEVTTLATTLHEWQPELYDVRKIIHRLIAYNHSIRQFPGRLASLGKDHYVKRGMWTTRSRLSQPAIGGSVRARLRIPCDPNSRGRTGRM
jgi:hypothetical protein